MRLNLWTEIRTASIVAQLGRVSAAGQMLGMHHATVIRHIDALEERLQTKLFQRHARGYTPTEAGEELLRTSNMVIEQLTQMLERIERTREEVSGQLIVTTIPIMDPLVLPLVGDYQSEHPRVQVIYHADVRTMHLAYGEAHVAIRAGTKPEHPDNVVTPLMEFRFGLFAAERYLRQHGRPNTIEDLGAHRFVLPEVSENRAPFSRWLLDRVSEQNIVLRTSDSDSAQLAIEAGLGIGFLGVHNRSPGLVELFPDYRSPEWASKIWLVTHVDLQRTLKVRSFTRLVQEAAKGWMG